MECLQIQALNLPGSLTYQLQLARFPVLVGCCITQAAVERFSQALHRFLSDRWYLHAAQREVELVGGLAFFQHQGSGLY